MTKFESLLLWGGTSWTFHFPCWSVDWLNLRQVLCYKHNRQKFMYETSHYVKNILYNNPPWSLSLTTFLLLVCTVVWDVVHRSFDRDFTCRADLSSIFFSLQFESLWNFVVYNTKIADSLHPYPLESKNWTQNGVFQGGKEDDIILGLSEESTPVWESVKGCVLLKSIVFMHRIVKKWNWNNKQVMSYFNWRNTWCQSLTWTVLSVPMWNAGWFRNVILVKGGKETWWSSELSH